MKYLVTFARTFVQEATVEVEASSPDEVLDRAEEYEKDSLAWGTAEEMDTEITDVELVEEEEEAA